MIVTSRLYAHLRSSIRQLAAEAGLTVEDDPAEAEPRREDGPVLATLVAAALHRNGLCDGLGQIAVVAETR
jgi:hypothetical protein